MPPQRRSIPLDKILAPLNSDMVLIFWPITYTEGGVVEDPEEEEEGGEEDEVHQDHLEAAGPQRVVEAPVAPIQNIYVVDGLIDIEQDIADIDVIPIVQQKILDLIKDVSYFNIKTQSDWNA